MKQNGTLVRINTKNFFKILKLKVPELEDYDRPFVHNTLGFLKAFTRKLVNFYVEDKNRKEIIKRIAKFANQCCLRRAIRYYPPTIGALAWGTF